MLIVTIDKNNIIIKITKYTPKIEYINNHGRSIDRFIK
jgi:hypothetical protein